MVDRGLRFGGMGAGCWGSWVQASERQPPCRDSRFNVVNKGRYQPCANERRHVNVVHSPGHCAPHVLHHDLDLNYALGVGGIPEAWWRGLVLGARRVRVGVHCTIGSCEEMALAAYREYHDSTYCSITSLKMSSSSAFTAGDTKTEFSTTSDACATAEHVHSCAGGTPRCISWAGTQASPTNHMRAAPCSCARYPNTCTPQVRITHLLETDVAYIPTP